MHELYFQGIETIHANLAEKDDKILELESAIKTKEYENEVCICGVTRKANRIAGKCVCVGGGGVKKGYCRAITQSMVLGLIRESLF